METLMLNQIIEAWQQNRQDKARELLKPCVQAIQLLAQGQPVSIDQFKSGDQLSEAQISNYWARLKKHGGEFDEHGNLIGNMLSLLPSPHRLQVNGHTLFAWC